MEGMEDMEDTDTLTDMVTTDMATVTGVKDKLDQNISALLSLQNFMLVKSWI